MEKTTPPGRSGTPDEAAGAGVLLGSPESDDLSGQTLVRSGGLTGFRRPLRHVVPREPLPCLHPT